MVRKALALIALVMVASLSIAGCTSSSTNSNQAASSASQAASTTASTTTSASTSASETPSAMPTAGPTATPAPIQLGNQIIAVGGQQFSIALHSNPTTGYEWQPAFNVGILELKSHTFISDFPTTQQANHIGAGGVDVFTFEALRGGATTIKFDYVRSFESGSLNETTYTVIAR